ncbi:MAG: LysM peptidoglycan-binding domain-containing protein [Sedimentisphaerales bacterium]|jgi:nucleoid-associated protein YgaU|nr:LysM peptidoglycan-binding domain-containing protein [Sedimentisphaerales bacterium]
MDKDFKIGMLLGLILAMAGILWLSTRPSLTPPDFGELSRAAGLPDSHNFAALQGPGGSPEKFADIEPIAESSGKTQSATTAGRTTAPDFGVHKQPENITTQRFHIVCKDETLSAISYRYYGSENNWQKIFQANRAQLKDPNRITPGTKLIIPD